MRLSASIAGKQLTVSPTSSQHQQYWLDILLLAVAVLGLACSGNYERVDVLSLSTPKYPIEARSRNIEGKVTLHISIGPDGKVLSAKGVGGHPLLAAAAEENVREWVFGPFPPDGEFPIWHTVVYEFRLEGDPLSVVLEPPIIRTHLPDGVDIIARPFKSDYPPTVPDTESGREKD